MLVLADADGFGINLDRFGQGVLNTAGNGDGAPDGDIQIGQLFAGQVGGGVNGGARFIGNNVTAGQFFFFNKG